VASSEATVRARHGRRPNLHPGGSIEEYSLEQIVALIQWIKSDTLLRDDEQILEEVMGELGFQRRGQRIRERIEQAIRLTH
jgi:hypothetical protein